jgi:hypothetical protein
LWCISGVSHKLYSEAVQGMLLTQNNSKRFRELDGNGSTVVGENNDFSSSAGAKMIGARSELSCMSFQSPKA